jgi:hypothetical protein
VPRSFGRKFNDPSQFADCGACWKARRSRAEQKSETQGKEGLSVQLPGVDVELEKGKGLEVQAPGTDVTVNKEGVNVTATNAEFEAKPKKGE